MHVFVDCILLHIGALNVVSFLVTAHMM